MPDLTPLEAAEKLEFIVDAQKIQSISAKADDDELYHAIEQAASLLRAIAAGEYKQVVHGEWIESNPQNSDVCRVVRCSNCGETHIVPYTIPLNEWEKNRNYCGSCGALMDGKDENYEPDAPR